MSKVDPLRGNPATMNIFLFSISLARVLRQFHHIMNLRPAVSKHCRFRHLMRNNLAKPHRSDARIRPLCRFAYSPFGLLAQCGEYHMFAAAKLLPAVNPVWPG
ncbi:MAG: hypothetical protein P4L91_02235 [Burkholderiaceae bacterium]|nr:hypothetical protein [Burkholderiaceae bacterium]